MSAIDAIVLYFQSISVFPSWTSRVRSPSPALIVFKDLQELLPISPVLLLHFCSNKKTIVAERQKTCDLTQRDLLHFYDPENKSVKRS
jgi:hypothetical protein